MKRRDAEALPCAPHVATGYGTAERAEAIALATTGFEVRIGRSIEGAFALTILRGVGAASARSGP